MNELGKTIIKGKLRIVTPVHVGGAQEKHKQRGLDYIVKDGLVYFLDEKKLIAHFGIFQYSSALSQGNLEQLCTPINLRDFSNDVVRNISGEIGVEIKTNIKNTLSGKPIIPGTSLKGSLRSVFYNHITNGNVVIEYDDRGRPKNMEQKYIGQISEDIFRYMIVSDVEFNQTSFINTKTFNLRSSGKDGLKGGWKHELRNNTTDQFKTSGFTFPHEVIQTGDVGDFSIIVNQKALSLAKNERKVKTNTYIDKIFQGNENEIFDIIQSYMDSYLNKEIAFFSKFETDQTGIILEELNRLKDLNKQAPLLRLGLGSGFHAMTGDTLHITHDINGIGNRNRGLYNDNDSAKSRKIAFAGGAQNLSLYPMGFVQLCSEDVFTQFYKTAFDEHKKAAIEIEANKKATEKADNLAFEAAKIKAAEDARILVEKEEIAKQEALKPKFIESLALKKAKWVDGIVVGQNGKMLQFKPFVIGFEGKVFEISYAAGMPIDTIIQVMCVSPNGKMLQFQGFPKVKNA